MGCSGEGIRGKNWKNHSETVRDALRANNAQLAEKKFIALQYRSRAEIARSAIFFMVSCIIGV